MIIKNATLREYAVSTLFGHRRLMAGSQVDVSREEYQAMLKVLVIRTLFSNGALIAETPERHDKKAGQEAQAKRAKASAAAAEKTVTIKKAERAQTAAERLKAAAKKQPAE